MASHALKDFNARHGGKEPIQFQFANERMIECIVSQISNLLYNRCL